MDKGKLIGMKEAGMSTRAVAREIGHDRKTMQRIWNEYQALTAEMVQAEADVR